MNTTEMQKAALEWSLDKWPWGTIERYGLGLSEEVGEVNRAILKRADGIRGTHAEWTAELRKELADVFIILLKMAEAEGFDLLEEANRAFERVVARDINHDPIGAK